MTPEEMKVEEKQWKEAGYSFFKDIELYPVMSDFEPDDGTERVDVFANENGSGMALKGNLLYLGFVKDIGDRKIFIYNDCRSEDNFDDMYRIVRKCFGDYAIDGGEIGRNITHIKKPKDLRSFKQVSKEPFRRSFTFNFTKAFMEEPWKEGSF